jgi:hypothetical protein
MERSPSWDANSHSASEESPSHLWNPKIYYSVHDILSLNDPYPGPDQSSP